MTAAPRRPPLPLRATAACAALAACAAPAVATAQDAVAPPWRLAAQARQHSDALALARFGDDDAAEHLAARGRRNLAYLDHELRLTHAGDSGRWSLLARQSATVVVGRGAIELAVDAETAGRPAGDRDWAVDGRYFGFGGEGLAWQRDFTLAPGWRLQTGVQALVLRRWRERRIEGSAAWRAATASYRIDLRSFEAGERLDFPYREPYAGRGQALLFDAEIGWTGERAAAALSLRDAGQLRWRGLPQNHSALSTDTQAVDDDGFIVYEPLVQGRNAQPARRRAGPLRLAGRASWMATPAIQLQGALDWLPHFGWLPQVGAAQALGDWRLGATLHVHERRATVDIGWRGLQLRAGADRLGRGARSRELAFAASWPL